MSHERLAQVMQTHQEAIEAGHEPRLAHETIVSVLRGLEHGDVTRGQAIRLLTYQALLADEATEVALYRQVAAALRQMPREEQENAPAGESHGQGMGRLARRGRCHANTSGGTHGAGQLRRESTSSGRGERRGGEALTWATQMERCLGYKERADAVIAT